MGSNKKLTAKQQKFVEHYAACGNATEAARLAGYSAKYTRENASKLLQNTTIQAALAALTKKVSSARIATAQERQEFWTAVMRGEFGDEAEMKDRLKASELLGKTQTDFAPDTVSVTNNIWITPETLRAIRETVYGLKTA